MVALAEPDASLTPGGAVDRHPARDAAPARTRRTAPEIAVPLDEKLAPTISRIEREMIKAALRSHHGTRRAAARALGISRKGLYLKRQRLGALIRPRSLTSAGLSTGGRPRSSRSSASIDDSSTRCDPPRVRIVASRPRRIR